MNNVFDIIIIGGGHAGVEAAHIASQFKEIKIAIISLKNIGLASAPCNPSIGGVGKGQVVRELDALGGLMPKLADLSGIQYRTLNESKGYAVQSTRVQIDKELYSKYAEEEISKISNIELIFDKVVSVTKAQENFEIQCENSYLYSKKVIMTVGTFLNGKMHIGSEKSYGGRINCDSSTNITSIFNDIKTLPKRFKTGTPPRLDRDTIDVNVLEEQPSDDLVRNFHFANDDYKRNTEQVSCYLAHTNNDTMTVIRENLNLSPMYNGQITATGARYCPSIEDKAARYPDKNVHHVFIEPESLAGNTFYPSGISSSLPKEVQQQIVNSIKGLENAKIIMYGYAVEYDVVDTTLLSHTLEHKDVEGLYFAGQVNGTSGYEEAAGQGYIAGVNAALNILGKNPLILSREDSYIGVMVEDLISNTRDEPYRLFTARSENRLYIREDNSIIRMHKYRSKLDLKFEVDDYNKNFFVLHNTIMKLLKKIYISEKNEFLTYNNIVISKRISLAELLRQAHIDPVVILSKYLSHIGLELDPLLIRSIAISNKYEGYINKAVESSAKIKKLEKMPIDWQSLLKSKNISYECKKRIEHIQPITFGQLKRIEGIRPATLAAVAGAL